MEEQQTLIVILGPTASGKTKLAVALATEIGGEIISADSRQVYKGMNIGTGKDYEEYEHVSGQKIPYHLIDIVEAGDEYHVARFQRDFKQAYQNIINRGKIPILCGGTGMYIEAVLKNYQHTQIPVDAVLRETIKEKSYEELLNQFQQQYHSFYPEADTSTRKRLIRAIEIARFMKDNPQAYQVTDPYKALIFGIAIPTEIRRERITGRLNKRLKEGMIEEVQALLNQGISPEKLIFYGLEYKFITEYLLGQLTHDEMVKRLEVAIHQFAKRQMTFFRSMEKKDLIIHWLDGMDSPENLISKINRQIAGENV
ncbi:tRNA (adenosine(37)-N6)-dimethylallyltransferase MiaA [Emticicia sp. BO119]|uniref:tRNA (adenosine(37)-N6)-dimethylallyltransferase MiaA n=1 Tax=Emticicia sp. BO119 TaxID=2757768 RepID=UPI0015F0D516|nr:tRNA (adenosine(37)-N6)-dimethylallyltransferase MiaA [Emticicia sp. BO119]MBA4848761.1 tRNA (adenosine(37)-N6)-dimethylallyltransferase MiaA [Emticicia sp. BO119]